MQLDEPAVREARQFAAELQRGFAEQPMLLELDLETARERMREQAERLDPALPLTVRARQIADGVGASVFAPETVRGVYLHLHGGGWCIGSSRTQDACRVALAVASGLAVMSVDYRLAPEHPFPAAVQDCSAALRWVLTLGLEELGGEVLLAAIRT